MKTISMPRHGVFLVLVMAQSLEALLLASSKADQEAFSPARGFDNILIFAMGKVGSTTMMTSLDGVYVSQIRESYPAVMKTHGFPVAMDYMQKLSPGRKTLVIALVRNPFAQQESLFFEHITCCYDDLSWDQAQQMSVAELNAEFPKHVPLTKYHDYWRNLRECTGVDVIQQEFDFDEHHLFARNEATRVSVLALRLEDIDHWQDIMKQYIPHFMLVTQNVGSHKVYSEQYEALRDSYVFPSDAIQTIRSHDSFHFYTKEERELFESLAGHPAQLQNMVNGTIAAGRDYVVVANQKLFMGDPDPDMDEEY